MTVAVLGVCVVGLAGCTEVRDLRKANAGLSAQLQSLTAKDQTLLADNQALKSKNEELQASLGKEQGAAKKASGVLDALKANQEKLRRQNDELNAIFKNIRGINIEGGGEGNFIVTESELLFDPGQIELKPSAAGALDKVAGYLQEHRELTIRIDGHTDGVPIKESKWEDNYHLSAMRAHAVMKYLIGKGIRPERALIAGFGPNKPRVQPKEPTEAVSANRRVEILLVPTGFRTTSQILEGLKD
jgi:chemotaxis protein MotB